MEEPLGVEPRIKDLQSNALATLLWLQQVICVYNGGEQGIRTLGGVTLAGFQNRYIRPTLSILQQYNVY